jgi:hypothetical protein
MKSKILCLFLLATLMFSGCGPTLQDSKVQYQISVDAATAGLNFADALRSAGKLSAQDVNTVKYAANRFEFYRVQVRSAIDANTVAPVNVRNGMAAALTEIVLVQINKEGVK